MQLINLLESVMGISKVLKKGEHAFYCPFCNHYKKKLQVNIISQMWRCWVCDKKGRSVFSLFKLLNVSNDKMKKLDEHKNDYIGKKNTNRKKIYYNYQMNLNHCGNHLKHQNIEMLYTI